MDDGLPSPADPAPDDARAATGDGKTLGEIGLDQFAPYLMNRAIGRWNAEIRAALKSHDLTTAQMRALAVLSVRRRPTIQELAVLTVTEQSTMSRTLDTLETRGMVRRAAHAEDGRARSVEMTETGAEAFARFWPHMREGYERMLAGIDRAEREAFVATLGKIVRNVRRHDI